MRRAVSRDKLSTYRQKRDFNTTKEPSGAVDVKPSNRMRFVIQKHDASRLHYDLRLELDGVFKSWAVTKGPSLNPRDKRLAVEVEDHPLDYGDFEGTIPEGQYGGGTVMLWDRGTWEPEGDPHEGYEKGRLTFRLEGEKLHGTWHLVRMAKRPRERQPSWLLIKADDAHARTEDDPDILDEAPLSVKTGRSLEEIAPGRSAKSPAKQKGASKKASPPKTAKPVKRASNAKAAKASDVE